MQISELPNGKGGGHKRQARQGVLGKQHEDVHQDVCGLDSGQGHHVTEQCHWHGQKGACWTIEKVLCFAADRLLCLCCTVFMFRH